MFRDLKSGDRLKCHDGSYEIVLLVEMRSDEQLLCEMTIDPYHTFCVTSRGIIVHNSPAIVISAAPVVIPMVVKTAGVVATIGAVFYSLFARHKSNKYSHSYYTIPSASNYSVSPMPHEDSRKTKYENMEQVFEKAPVGKKLQSFVEPTKFSYKTSKIYRVVRDIRELGIREGDWLYLDRMHGDHIEVFKKCGKVMRTILNMDGTQNLRKLAQAGVRSIEKYIK